MSVVLKERDGGVCVLTLNRPDKLNALNVEMLATLELALVELDNDSTVRCVVLTGAGEKAFVAGADIATMQDMTSMQAKSFSDMGHRVCARLERAHYPVIGAVNGFALGGGCELALACDFLYASEKAKFGQPEVNLGVIPGFGGTQRLSRRVGEARARELCFTGDVIDAGEALRVGLVNRVLPAGELLAAAKATAAKICTKGPLAVGQAKRTILRGADVPLDIANELEAQAFATLFDTEDQREGMRAFLDKRSADFKGT
ncbi:MAG: enoyl-CoA hydratase/isomerase family protein [Myxococcales bacterium]|nr:enoyl-CoA hydratase/isomerase family protein [Myxococcales bacterium]